jgi:hypothetical protein
MLRAISVEEWLEKNATGEFILKGPGGAPAEISPLGPVGSGMLGKLFDVAAKPFSPTGLKPVSRPPKQLSAKPIKAPTKSTTMAEESTKYIAPQVTRSEAKDAGKGFSTFGKHY